MKISIEDMIAALNAEKIPSATIQKVVKTVTAAAQEEKDDKEPKVKAKLQFVILAEDPEGQYANVSLIGHVLQLEGDAAPQSAVDRAIKAAESFNVSRKGRKNPIKNIREALSVGRKFWKDDENPQRKTLVKTKEPVAIQIVGPEAFNLGK